MTTCATDQSSLPRLRLHFPHAVIEDGRERAQYDIATGIITVHLPKAEHGQWFEDLGLMTRLLAKRSASGNATAASATAIGSVPPMTSSGIEVLSSTTTATVDDGDDNDTENLTEDHIVEMMRENFRLEFTDHDHDDGVIDDAGNEDVVELQGRVEPSVEPLLTSKGYGFNSAYRGLFAGFEEFEVLQDMIDVGNPEIALRSTTVDERRQRRRDMEDASFDEDRYVADFMDAEMVDEVCKWRAWWDRMREEWEGIVGGFGRMSVDADMPEDADVERRRLAAANDDNAARPVPRRRPEVMFSERDNEIMERLAKGVDGHRLKCRHHKRPACICMAT